MSDQAILCPEALQRRMRQCSGIHKALKIHLLIHLLMAVPGFLEWAVLLWNLPDSPDMGLLSHNHTFPSDS